MKRNKVKFITPIKMVRKAMNILLRVKHLRIMKGSYLQLFLRLSLMQLKH